MSAMPNQRRADAEVFNLFYTVDPTDIPSSGGGPP